MSEDKIKIKGENNGLMLAFPTDMSFAEIVEELGRKLESGSARYACICAAGFVFQRRAEGAAGTLSDARSYLSPCQTGAGKVASEANCGRESSVRPTGRGTPLFSTGRSKVLGTPANARH